jgi:hypothetical protein
MDRPASKLNKTYSIRLNLGSAVSDTWGGTSYLWMLRTSLVLNLAVRDSRKQPTNLAGSKDLEGLDSSSLFLK